MAYITGASLVGVYSCYMLFRYGLHIGWLGAFLTSAPFMASVGWWMLSHTQARTSAALTPYTVVGFIGLALGFWSLGQGEADAALAFGLAAAGLAGFLIYLRWYSYFGREPSAALTVGQTLPEFDLEDGEGGSVSSKSFQGKPALYLFYRGNWCPLCMAQIKEIAGQYQELAERGVAVVLISPQPHAHSRKLARRHDVPFHFLIDAGNRVAENLGIAAPGGLPAGMEVLGYDSDTVLPTVVITDAQGIIIFADQTDNYRVRPEPETFLAVLDGTRNQVKPAFPLNQD
jgi:peroxiredoxin